MTLGVARPVAQMLDQVGDICELLLEIALIALEPFEQLLPVGEWAMEAKASVMPVPVMSVVHVHLPSA